MSKDDRNEVNPFSGKKHFDMVDDDEFLMECYNYYYEELSQYQLLDETPDGQIIFNVASILINTVNDYLKQIGRYDYVEDYYDWEVHLVNSNVANACCYPGGKIIVYAGILSLFEHEDELAFVLAHEISHALLDHSRTSASVDKAKSTVSSVSWMSSFALDLMGFHGAGELARAAVNVADIGSDYFLTQPWGRDHELEADKLGLMISYLAGYNVSIIPDFWQKFSGGNNNFDFFSTHPSDDKRIAVMRESLYEITGDNSLYSGPLLSETPKAKNEFKNSNFMPTSLHHSNSSGSTTMLTGSDVKSLLCPNCGNSVRQEDNFCMQCGFKLKNRCPNCGNDVEVGDNFCINCGSRL